MVYANIIALTSSPIGGYSKMQTVDCLDVIIEITPEINGVKYEYDKDHNALRVDRFMATPHMHYPLPYGFAPGTLSEDGDPLDVLVVVPYPILPGVRIKVRPVGALVMEDEAGLDEKILAVPDHELLADSISGSHDAVTDGLKKQIEHFFANYKDLEQGRWVKIDRWVGLGETQAIIKKAILAI